MIQWRFHQSAAAASSWLQRLRRINDFSDYHRSDVPLREQDGLSKAKGNIRASLVFCLLH